MLAKGPDETGAAIADDLRELGFDYIELSLAQIAVLPEPDYQVLCRRVRESGIRSEACNNFFPPSLRLTGPEYDPSRIMAYARPAMERAARLGVEIIVFGSGPAKRVPTGFSMSTAWSQLVELTGQLAITAMDLGLNIAIEPLRREECNIINSAAEGLSLVRATATESVKLLVDFYHLCAEGESCKILAEAGDRICHIHLAKPEGRRFPVQADSNLYQEFFDALIDIEYEGRISVEAYSDDFRNDAAASLAFLRQAFVERKAPSY